MVQGLVGPLLVQRPLLAAGGPGGHADLHLRECERQEAQILQQPAPRGQGRGRRISNGLLMDATSIGVAEAEDREQGIDQECIFYRMVLFLAARTRGLFSRVLGADDAPFRPVMGTRGDAGTAGTVARGAGASSSGTTTVAASASETPTRCARAGRERGGASPRARSAASN